MTSTGKRIVVLVAGMFFSAIGGGILALWAKTGLNREWGDLALAALGATFALHGVYLVGLSAFGSDKAVRNTYKGVLRGL